MSSVLHLVPYRCQAETFKLRAPFTLPSNRDGVISSVVSDQARACTQPLLLTGSHWKTLSATAAANSMIVRSGVWSFDGKTVPWQLDMPDGELVAAPGRVQLTPTQAHVHTIQTQ